LALAALPTLCATGAAEDPPPTPKPKPAAQQAWAEDVAREVAQAHAAGDGQRVAALAQGQDPDPWRVLDRLVADREWEAAKAFCEAATGPDVEALGRYLAGREAAGDDSEARKAWEAISALMRRREPPERIVEVAAEAPRETDTVPAIMVRRLAIAALAKLGRTEEALTKWTEIAEAARRIGWLRAWAEFLGEAGDHAYEQSDPARALEFTLLAVEAHRARGALDRVMRSTGFAARLLDGLGRWREALERLEEKRLLAETLGAARAVAEALGDIGLVHYALADYPLSLEYQRRALAAYEALSDLDGMATTELNIGIVHERLGDLGRARAKHQRALRLAEEARAPGTVATAILNLGMVHFDMAEYADARARFEDALARFEALEDRAKGTLARMNLAGVAHETGDDEEATTIVRRALIDAEELQDPVLVSQCLGALALFQSAQGQHQEALELYRRSLALAETIGDLDGVAASLGDLGLLHLDLHEWDQARLLFERSLELAGRIGRRPYAITALINLSKVEIEAGEPKKAVGLAERAAREAERIRYAEGLVGALTTMGRAHLALGDAALALATVRRAIPFLDPSLGRHADREAGLARSRHEHVFALGLEAAARQGLPDEVVYFMEEGRAGALLEALGGRDLVREGALPESLLREDVDARAAEAAAAAAYGRAVDGGDRQELSRLDEVLKAAREHRWEVVERIQRTERASADVLYPRAAPLDEIRSWLEADQHLVLFALGSDRAGALAVVVSPESARLVPLGLVEPIERECAALLDAVSDATSGEDVASLVRRLRTLLVAPLNLPSGARNLLVSADGGLCYVPPALLFDGRAVAVVPSATTYGHLLAEGAERGDGVLAIGDPPYGAGGPERAPVRSSWQGRLARLPETREEAQAVGTTVLLGPEATELRLRETLPMRQRWRAIHFACHALVDASHPLNSALALGPGEADDGFLNTLDVMRLRIPCDLLTLSACETARGTVIRGEGVVGLTRAFMLAGAPRVLCSLWKVDDAATRALMVKFYELWNPRAPSNAEGKAPPPLGLPASEALRRAQEFVRSQERWKHPFFWAAWVLWGLPD
jgi:CHAT domain-containing protein/Tfp pilus assembly protein PilF